MLPTEPALQQLISDRADALHETARHIRLARRDGLRTTFSLRRRLRRPVASAGAIPGVARPPAPFTATFAEWAETLGAAVAEHGIARYERAVGGLVKLANRHSLSPDVTGVLADRAEPPAARERALGMVLVALAGRPLASVARTDRDVA